jgi:nucleotide-binding universal stress UspA family protein
MTARSPMNDGRPTALTSWLTASGDPGSRPREGQTRAAADLPDDRAVTPVGFDCVEDDPWTGWPSTTPDQDGAAPDRRRVLVPYCGTRTAEAALETAADWCHALAAEAWVLYVRPWDPVRGGRNFLETPAEARAVAQVAVGRLRGRGVSASGVVRDASRGRISDTIVAEAEALGACSIVMGTPVRRVLSEVLLGSTSLAVARRSPRPVILVKAPKRPSISQRPSRPVPPPTSTQRPEGSRGHRQDGS